MKKFFAQLRPLERRLAVGVLVVLILVLNWVFIWPHRSDWGNLKNRLAAAQKDLARDQAAIAEMPKYEAQVKGFESQGEFVALEDQSINFLRTIQSQALASGVAMGNMSRPITRTNDAFFVEQIQNINVIATDEQLVDFLYKLGSSASMIRVRDLELQPDQAQQHLNANIGLVASYQKTETTNHLKTATAKSK
jgi:Tfp pilus assembly protein PilO